MKPEQVNRRCGDCTACCTALSVKDMGLAEGQKCQHEKRHGGCAIYNDRPDGCRSFECLWLQGGLSAKDRPDKIGAIFSANADGDKLQVFELRADAAKRGRAHMWIEKIREVTDVYVLRGPDKPRTLLGQHRPNKSFTRRNLDTHRYDTL